MFSSAGVADVLSECPNGRRRSGSFALRLPPFVLAGVMAVLASFCAGNGRLQAQTQSSTNDIILEVFVRNDSEFSQKALEYLANLEKQQPGLKVVVYDLLDDKAALTRYYELVKTYRVEKPALPAFYCCRKFAIGFTSPEKSGPKIDELRTMHAYVRNGCPHCRDAKAFFVKLKSRWPALIIREHEIFTEAGAQTRMNELARQFRTLSSLPGIYMCGTYLVGYDTDATSGKRIEQTLRDAQPVLPAEAPRQESSSRSFDRRLPHRGWDADFLRKAALIAVLGQVSSETSGKSELPAGTDPLPALPDESERPEGLDLPPPQDSSKTRPTPGELPPGLPDEALPGESSGTGEVFDPLPFDPAGGGESSSPAGVDVPFFGTLKLKSLGLPALTFLVGLIDGFNPCAMWVLVFLLTVLVNLKSRAKMIVVAGTFVFISGFAYFLFMALYINVSFAFGNPRWLQVVLGCLAVFIGAVNVKDFFAFKRGLSFSIPESAKPGIYERVRKIVAAKSLVVALWGAIVLAITVNVVEFLCTAGLPVAYTQVLAAQNLPLWENYAYILLYNIAYMFDDTLMLGIVVVTLSHRRLQEKEGRWLKLVSGAVMLALGLVMVFFPQWLTW